MTRDFAGMVAVVTGAAQGIGRATATRLATEGAMVIIADRAAAEGARCAEEISSGGGTAVSIACDLESQQETAELFSQIARDFGRLDVAVNNVGGAIWFKPFWEFSREEVEAEISRSLWPTIWCSQEEVKLMIAQRSGSIVNVGSFATRGIRRMPYSTAKGGVEALTKSLALEVAEYGIRVNCISSGGVDIKVRATPRSAHEPDARELEYMRDAGEQTIRDTPMKRLGTPEEIANPICFLASSEASYITGQTIYVAGGGIG